MQTVRFEDLGLKRYQEAWDYQTALHRRLVENKLANRHLSPKSYPQEHHLLLVEHPPVYTLGKSGSMDHLLLSEMELLERGIEFFPINRGGDITFHGPGQIVGYPILDLECFFTDVHRYVRNIEEVIIRTIAEYGIEGYRIEGYTGVWVAAALNIEYRMSNIEYRRGMGDGGMGNGETTSPNRWPNHLKICAIGVHLSRWTTLHGWAFNVNTPLEYFDYIVPCGIDDQDKGVTSLGQLLGKELAMEEVKAKIKRHFAAVFECEIIG